MLTAGVLSYDPMNTMPKTLLVDPDPELYGLLTERLRDFRIEVIHAETGLEGFKKAKQETPDLIIQELALPDISGFYLLEKLRTTEETFLIPVMVLTHRKDADLEERVRQVGVKSFTRKPYPVKSFLSQIRDLATKPVDIDQARKILAVPKSTAAYRLVTERLEIEIRTDQYLLRGITSGINENGLGANMNLLELHVDDPAPLAPGQPCTVYFRSMKYPLIPCQGTVLRIEESWDRRYSQFVAVKFLEEEAGGMPNSDRQSLREWIQAQIKLI